MKALEIIAYIAAVLFTLLIAERWYSARRGDREAASHCATNQDHPRNRPGH